MTHHQTLILIIFAVSGAFLALTTPLLFYLVDLGIYIGAATLLIREVVTT